MAIALSGSLVITGSIFATQGITGSFSGNATSASYADTLQGLGSASFAPAATFNTVSQSFATTSGSLSTRVTNLESTSSTVSSSFASTSGSIAGRVTLIEGQYATTGSNTFTGPQYVSQASNAISFTSTASLYTDGGLRVAKDSFVSGTAYFNNITVYGTSSIEYITSSQVNIGSNVITVNTDTPAIRFGGISVFDSGSTQLTGSLFWDSEKNHWIYSNPSGSAYNSAMLMNGPRNTGSLGTEQGTTNNALMKGQGGDHITSSQMIDDGTTVQIPGNLQVTGSLSGSSAVFNSTVNASNGLLIGNGGATATTNYLPKFTGTSTIGNSQIFDNGSFVGINTSTPNTPLSIVGNHVSGQSVLKVQSSTAYSSSGLSSIGFNDSDGSRKSIVYTNSDGLQLETSISSPILFNINGGTRMTLNASGNLGLGVTPSAWSVVTGLQVLNANISSVGGNTNNSNFGSNFYYDGTNFRYIGTSFATNLKQLNGGFEFYTAPSGTAGNAISFTQAMTLFSDGNLALNTTTNAGYKLDVSGTGRFSGNLRVRGGTNFGGYYMDYQSDATSRSFRVSSEHLVFGDFVIQRSTTRTGTTYEDLLYFDANRAATFSSSVTAQSLDVISSSGVGSSTASGLARFITAATTTAISIGQSNNTRRLDIGSYYINVTNEQLELSTASAQPLIFNTSATERMRITSGGTVLVNATTSTYGAASGYSFGVRGTNSQTLISIALANQTLDTQGVYIGLDGAIGYITMVDNKPWTFATNNTERMRITSGGQIYTSNAPLDDWSMRVIGNSASGQSYGLKVLGGTNSADLAFSVTPQNGSVNYIYIRGDGYLYSASAWSGSDIRLKENITDLENGLEKILKLKARKFDLIDSFKNQFGFIAQELQQIIPDAVSIFQEKDQMLAIKMDFIIPHLVKAIQELKAELDQAKVEIEILKNK